MKRRCCRQTRTQDRQLDLLDANGPSVSCESPQWDLLPQQARGVLTGLMARLLVEHAGGQMCDRRSCANDQ